MASSVQHPTIELAERGSADLRPVEHVSVRRQAALSTANMRGMTGVVPKLPVASHSLLGSRSRGSRWTNPHRDRLSIIDIKSMLENTRVVFKHKEKGVRVCVCVFRDQAEDNNLPPALRGISVDWCSECRAGLIRRFTAFGEYREGAMAVLCVWIWKCLPEVWGKFLQALVRG